MHISAVVKQGSTRMNEQASRFHAISGIGIENTKSTFPFDTCLLGLHYHSHISCWYAGSTLHQQAALVQSLQASQAITATSSPTSKLPTVVMQGALS